MSVRRQTLPSLGAARPLPPIGAAEVAVDVERAVKLDNLTHGEFPSACQTGCRTPRPVGRPWLQLSRDLRKVPAAAFHARPATVLKCWPSLSIVRISLMGDAVMVASAAGSSVAANHPLKVRVSQCAPPAGGVGLPKALAGPASAFSRIPCLRTHGGGSCRGWLGGRHRAAFSHI
jgi:hypothetical protein